MIKITFDKSYDIIEKIKTAISLNIYIGLCIKVDDKSVFEDIEDGEFYSEFIYSFLSDCLISLPRLYNKEPMKYEATEVPNDFIIFKPVDSRLSLVFESKVYHMRREFWVELKDLAREVIISSREFLGYVLGINPALKNERSVKVFQERIDFAKDWFYKTYGDKV